LHIIKTNVATKSTFDHLKIIGMVTHFENVPMVSKTKIGVRAQKDNNPWTCLSIKHVRKKNKMIGIMIY